MVFYKQVRSNGGLLIGRFSSPGVGRLSLLTVKTSVEFIFIYVASLAVEHVSRRYDAKLTHLQPPPPGVVGGAGIFT